MFDIMIQVGIMFTGVIAVTLSQSRQNYQYACLFGLAGQPLWVIALYTSEQWGILILSVFYAYAWWRGFKLHWLSTGKFKLFLRKVMA